MSGDERAKSEVELCIQRRVGDLYRRRTLVSLCVRMIGMR